MKIKLLVGSDSSRKSKYLLEHRSDEDIVALSVEDQLIFEDQSIADQIMIETGFYRALRNNVSLLQLAIHRDNGIRLSKLSLNYFMNRRGKELIVWIKSEDISEEAIDYLAESYRDRLEIIEFL